MKRSSKGMPFFTGFCEPGGSGLHNKCPFYVRLSECECQCHEGVLQSKIVLDAFDQAGDIIHVGDKVKMYAADGMQHAKVLRIFASAATHEVLEVEVITGNGKKDDATAYRTVTPDKLTTTLGRRHQQKVSQDMKLGTFKGELPKRTSGGRTRTATPFDQLASGKEGVKHSVSFEKDDVPAVIKRQIISAAKLHGKGVKFYPTPEGDLVFVFGPKRASSRTAAEAA